MDQERIDRHSRELTEIAELAGLGLTDWWQFSHSLASVIPGCLSVFMQNDVLSPDYSLLAYDGFDVSHIDSYLEHFAAVNPWNRFWAAAPAGTVFRSSGVLPSDRFRGTEFYNDWLTPLGKCHDGIGIKLHAAAHLPIILSMQLPDNELRHAEAVMEPIIQRLSSVLIRSTLVTYQLRAGRQRALAAAAIVDREPEMAFAIDDRLRVIEANGAANTSLSFGTPATCRNGVIQVKSDAAHKWLKQAVALLANRLSLPDHRFLFVVDGVKYRMSVARIPEHEPWGANRFTFPRYLNLVTIRNVEISGHSSTSTALSQHFQLTPAEIRMCEALTDNLTLSQCADRCEITRETARQRLKQIFEKTSTHRQAELVALLLRLGL